jgi:hypothetical protein
MKMKTKQQTIDRIVERFKCDPYGVPPLNILKQVLQEELPDFNPMKIDEDRFEKEVWNKHYEGEILYIHSVTKELVQKYNSTLPEPLMPLPSRDELENDIWGIWGAYSTDRKKIYEIARFLTDTYGTPEKEPLPSVEELEKELQEICINSDWANIYKHIAQHLISKYSLHTKQEWWMKLKNGDKFSIRGETLTYVDTAVYLRTEAGRGYNVIDCTPYTPPTAQDIIAKHNLTDEEVRVIREGKVAYNVSQVGDSAAYHKF